MFCKSFKHLDGKKMELKKEEAILLLKNKILEVKRWMLEDGTKHDSGYVNVEGNITGQLARGEVVQAQSGLQAVGTSLNSIPDIDRPTLPEKPGRNRN